VPALSARVRFAVVVGELSSKSSSSRPPVRALELELEAAACSRDVTIA
jgi:hypothetical protein